MKIQEKLRLDGLLYNEMALNQAVFWLELGRIGTESFWDGLRQMTENTIGPTATSPLAKIMMASGQVGYHWDLKADHLIWFGEWQKLFGYDRTHPPHNRATFEALILPEDRAKAFQSDGATVSRSYRLHGPQGHTIVVREQGAIERDASGPLRQCGVLVLVEQAAETPATAIIHTEPEAAYDTDMLTQRLNRQGMKAQLERLLAAPMVERQKATYLVIGIDKMAFINEALGTKASDDLLCSVAATLETLAPGKALLGRVSGDIFGLLLPDPLGQDFSVLSEAILQKFRSEAVPTSKAPFFITVSIGALRLGELGQEAAESMIRAEQALNEARLRGRNVMVEYQMSAPHIEARREIMEMGERFKYALLNNKLRLAFQPVIDALTGQVVFYEALIRMFRDDGSIIPACDFVPAIEEMGLSLDLDYHVLDLTLAELEAYPDLRLAMNISGLTASRTDWPDYLSRKLAGRTHLTQRLIIEITETVAISDLSETKRFAETLNQLGGSVAIDDFGAGFTSIRHLSTLALSIMKIDKEMLNGIPGNADQEHLLRMMVAIAHGLGLKTVAEGIETEDVARWLIREKVDMMQGYYFGKPSIDRPWIALKGADMPAQGVQEMLGGKLFGSDSPTQIRIGAVSSAS